jgi:hypothetical protein
MFKGKVLLFALLLLVSTSLYAGEVDDCLSDVSLVNCTAMQLNICPAADFDQIRTKCGGGTGYISIVAKDGADNGIAGIPWTDYWMDACDPGDDMCLCCDGVVADSLTNSNGETTISGFVGGGGCVLIGGVYVAIQNKTILVYDGPGCPAQDPICLDIEIRSPDNVCDGVVNLSDYSAFVSSWALCSGQANYDECFDFIDNDCVDLSDFSAFATHWQHECR